MHGGQRESLSVGRLTPPITRTKWQKISRFRYVFIFFFILPPPKHIFPLMMPLNRDSPQILLLPKSPLSAVRGFGCTHSLLVMVVAFNSELKKKKKKERQTHFRIMLFPSQCPHTHTPSLSHTPQTHLFDASTPSPQKK